MEIKESLIAIVGKDWVADNFEVLNGYSADLSLVPSRFPDYVVKPSNAGEIVKLIELANEIKLPLIPVSSLAQGRRGATIPRLGGVIMDLSRMDKIIRVDRKNRVTLIETGVTFAKLLPELDRAGLRLAMPLLPPPDKSVVAWALEREPAIMPRYHWDSADPLLCTEVVFGTGELFHTGESAGPGSLEEQWKRGGAQKFPLGPHQVDYHRLVQGSQGTMGVVTWATLKCELKPSKQKIFLIAAKKAEELFDFSYRVIKLDLADELFIVNGVTLASLLAHEALEIEALQKSLPPWILILGVAGLEYLPEERIAYRTQDILEAAQKYGVKPEENLPGVRGDKLSRILAQPSEETYWKLRLRGGCQELFFLTTLNKAGQFIESMYAVADHCGFPIPDLGIYLQPIVQGTSCHIGFDLFYSREEQKFTAKMKEFYRFAIEALMREGAFFNRPYPMMAEQVYSRYAEYTTAARRLKSVFDPQQILNPGKLCF